jgi:hypothetical protein
MADASKVTTDTLPSDKDSVMDVEIRHIQELILAQDFYDLHLI